ncbi:MAG: SDR family oxidoreductase [Actinobacteria bacterium]|nr:SDR family oxidoreductase [Actinomycetota bacterium]
MGDRLAGRRALVTGASRGIGRAIALAFAAEGAHVVALARNGELLAELVADIDGQGGSASFVVCDVTDPEAVGAATAAIAAEGPIDVLVNNAGGNSFSAPVVMMRPTGWTKTQTLNVDSTFWMLQGVLPSMVAAGGGSVINVSSVAGLAGAPLMAHYGAAKAAILSLTRSAALEVAASGVRVNALVPGWVETDLTDFLRHDSNVESSLLDRVPMQRWGTPEEIAAAAVFLAGDESSFMTGQTLVVDGGLSVMP